MALIQTDLARVYLKERLPECEFDLLKLSTTGDNKQDWSLEGKGGKGLFTKELERALIDGRADLAVHSAKDLPMELEPGLAIAGYLPRADAHDVLVLDESRTDPRMIASGSPRRRAQSRLLYPKSEWCEIRGNVETRLKKISSGSADATILAAAGLNRLGIDTWPKLVFKTLSYDEMVPAAGQGAIAIECRADDTSKYRTLLDEDTRRAITIERILISELGGGCHSSHAAYFSNDKLLVYHEDHGLKEFHLAGMSDAEIENRLREIVNELQES